MSLVNERVSGTPNVLQVESFEDTFGTKARRKRPKISAYTYEDLLKDTSHKQEEYDESKDVHMLLDEEGKDVARDKRLEAGQSKRIWRELYKVLDSSDVVCEVLDARNPMGTRCPHV